MESLGNQMKMMKLEYELEPELESEPELELEYEPELEPELEPDVGPELENEAVDEFESRNKKVKENPPVNEMSLNDIISMLLSLKEEVDVLKRYIKKVETKKEDMRTKEDIDFRLHRKCSLFFEDWVKQITINDDQLQKVFLNNLTDGIKECLSDSIKLYGTDVIPIQSIKKRSGTLYIYSKECNDWEICTQPKLSFCIATITNEFAKAFIQYKSVTLLEDERSFDYFVKVSGIKIKKEKQYTEIKAFLLSLLSSL